MQTNEQVIRDVYAAAEAKDLDTAKFVSLFADDGYVMNMASGQKWTGKEIPQWLDALVVSFPDIHRELLSFYSTADDVVTTEVKLQGTQKGDLQLPGGVFHASGKKFDVPCTDVFRLKDSKVASFHCYNMWATWLEQLGALEGPGAAIKR